MTCPHNTGPGDPALRHNRSRRSNWPRWKRLGLVIGVFAPVVAVWLQLGANHLMIGYVGMYVLAVAIAFALVRVSRPND